MAGLKSGTIWKGSLDVQRSKKACQHAKNSGNNDYLHMRRLVTSPIKKIKHQLSSKIKCFKWCARKTFQSLDVTKIIKEFASIFVLWFLRTNKLVSLSSGWFFWAVLNKVHGHLAHSESESVWRNLRGFFRLYNFVGFGWNSSQLSRPWHQTQSNWQVHWPETKLRDKL